MTVYIGENIKRLRQQRELTQETLAEFLGVSFQSVSRWERGESYPDITMLPAIASFFNVTVDELLGVNKVHNEEKIGGYLELYDIMKLKDIHRVYDEYKKAAREFPGDFRIQIRYMQLLQEAGIFGNSLELIASGEYKKLSAEISRIYGNIQSRCTDDGIRIWSKRVMISHLMWKYYCICDEEGKYQVYEEYLNQAKEIAETLPCLSDSKELMAIRDGENCYGAHKTAIEELIFHLHEELFGHCLNYSPEDRIKQYEALQGILDLIYPDGNYGKNSFNRLYNYGHLGHLYHQAGDDNAALEYLRTAAEYANELDNAPDGTEQIKRFYNYGTAYREMSASEFMRTVMTEHYPLSEEFKSTREFGEIVDKLKQIKRRRF